MQPFNNSELNYKGKQVAFDGLVRSQHIFNSSEKALKNYVDSSIEYTKTNSDIMGVKARIRRIENDILGELKALDRIAEHTASLPYSLRDSNQYLIESIKDTINYYQYILHQKYQTLIELSD
jgi:hypothetical protein